MKDKNRIEIIGAYYIEIVIGKNRFKLDKFYEFKSSALRTAKNLSAILILPIYDYGGYDPVYNPIIKIDNQKKGDRIKL